MRENRRIHITKIVRGLIYWGLSTVVLFSTGAGWGGSRISAQTRQSASGDSHFKTFGAPPHLTGDPISLSQALQPSNLGKPVRIKSKVSEVCQQEGCWMILTEGERAVRVTFKDHGFVVPKDIAGKTVIVEGTLSERTISQANARHYAEDAGKGAKEIEKIVGDQKEAAMVAETVLIQQ